MIASITSLLSDTMVTYWVRICCWILLQIRKFQLNALLKFWIERRILTASSIECWNHAFCISVSRCFPPLIRSPWVSTPSLMARWFEPVYFWRFCNCSLLFLILYTCLSKNIFKLHIAALYSLGDLWSLSRGLSSLTQILLFSRLVIWSSLMEQSHFTG